MEYPGARFTRPIRLLVLGMFILAFFITAPAVILYTAGYRYDVQNGFLRATGSLSIDVLPKDALVYLNGLRIKEKMPIRLKNITPQKYQLSISAPGYLGWQKEIEVAKNQTIYIKEIALLKKNSPEQIVNQPINWLSLSPNGRYLLYSDNISLWLRDNTEAKTTLLPIVFDSKKNTITWNEKNNYFVINNINPPYTFITVISAANPENRYDLTVLETGPITRFVWRKSGEVELYYSTNTSIKAFNPNLNEQHLISPNTYLDWNIEDGRLWTLSTNTTTGEVMVTKDALGFAENFATISINDTPSNPKIPPTDWKFFAAKNNTAILKNNNNNQLLLITPDKKFIISGETIITSKYNSWWIIFTPWEIWTYSEGESPNLLLRSSEKIDDLALIDKFNTLALQTKNSVIALFPYYLIENKLINTPINALEADTDNKIMYYADKKGLWKLEY